MQQSIPLFFFFNFSTKNVFSFFSWQAHNKLQEVLDMMVKCGSIDLSPSVQASLASRQYITTVSEAADGEREDE